MAFTQGRWDIRCRASFPATARDAAHAEPLDGPVPQDEVLLEVGTIIATLLGAAALANMLLAASGVDRSIRMAKGVIR